MIMSGRMLLDWLAVKHGEPRAATAAGHIDRAMERVIDQGRHLTRDLGGTASTAIMGDAVTAAI
jgi:3-isopropylmalate dehydrogenase